MPLKISIDAVYITDEGENAPAEFDVEISSDDTIVFADPDFDIEAELALKELGFGTTSPQVVFYDVFIRGGIPSLLLHETFWEDVGLALEGEAYKQYGTTDNPYSDKDLAQDLGKAFKVAVYNDDLWAIDHISSLITGLIKEEVAQVVIYYLKTPADSGHSFESGIWYRMQLFVGGVEIAEWNRYGEKEIQDPVNFFVESPSYTADIDLSTIEHAISMLDLTEEALEFPGPDYPESDPKGCWGVVYINMLGENLGFDREGELHWKPSFDFVTYASLADALEAVDLSLDIIDHQSDVDDWRILIVKYDGVFGDWNLVKKMYPELAADYPEIVSEANVLIPWALHSEAI